MALSILIVDIGYWTYQRYWCRDLRITAIDVGQGAATLLEFPLGHNMLLDGGGFSDNDVFDIGRLVVAPFLWRKKIKTVDTLVLSHPNSDHLNGLIYIAEHFKVKRVWTNSEAVESKGYRDFNAAVAKNRIYAPPYPVIPKQHDINGVNLKILYPPDDFLYRNDAWRNTNNNSLVIQLAKGSKRILLPGDIMKNAEAELVTTAGNSLQSTVLFSAHHGSRTSSSDLFLKTVSPEVVVVSAGWQNRFKLPHPAILRKYEDYGCRVFRTDLNGAIELRTDGRKLTIKPFIQP
jgi:competence protein ComEC